MGAVTSWLRVKNWSEFQHYKDRNPPWIKLHRALLDDYAFSALPDAQKAHLVLVWLFAASQQEGKVPNDAAFLSRKLGTSEPIDLETLINAGFLILEQDASKPLADRKQGASESLAFARSQESESETEKISCAISSHGGQQEPDGFAECWESYPKREGGNSKTEALKAYRARVKAGVPPEDLLSGVRRYATYNRATGKEGTAFVKQAATFFGPGEHWKEPWAVADPGGGPASAAATDYQQDPIFKGAI